MLNIALFGAPGAGKGTQSELLAKRYNLIHLSTGEMLRHEIAEETEIGLFAKSIIARGELVSDDIIVQIIEDKIKMNPNANGFLFDGFPRTVVQAYILDGLLLRLNTVLTCMLSLEAPKEVLYDRLIKRANESGRNDDTHDVVMFRLKEYEEKTLPVADFYREKNKYHGVNGIGSIEEIFNSLNVVIEKTLRETLLNVVVIGRPGGGKGSQGHLLAKEYNLAYISSGQILRNEVKKDNELGKRVMPYLQTGLNVPDEIIIQMLEKEIKLHPDARGFIFKGFPRTIVQAYILDGMLMRQKSSVSLAIDLEVPMLECFKRLSMRAKTSKRRTYDTETDLIIRRMEEYELKTKPVIEYYKKLNKYTLVDGIGSETEIYEKLSGVVEKWFKKIR